MLKNLFFCFRFVPHSHSFATGEPQSQRFALLSALILIPSNPGFTNEGHAVTIDTNPSETSDPLQSKHWSTLVLDFFPTPVQHFYALLPFLSPTSRKIRMKALIDRNWDGLLCESFVLDRLLEFFNTKLCRACFPLDLTLCNWCGYINLTESECINHHRVHNGSEITEKHTLSYIIPLLTD